MILRIFVLMTMVIQCGFADSTNYDSGDFKITELNNHLDNLAFKTVADYRVNGEMDGSVHASDDEDPLIPQDGRLAAVVKPTSAVSEIDQRIRFRSRLTNNGEETLTNCRVRIVKPYMNGQRELSFFTWQLKVEDAVVNGRFDITVGDNVDLILVVIPRVPIQREVKFDYYCDQSRAKTISFENTVLVTAKSILLMAEDFVQLKNGNNRTDLKINRADGRYWSLYTVKVSNTGSETASVNLTTASQFPAAILRQPHLCEPVDPDNGDWSCTTPRTTELQVDLGAGKTKIILVSVHARETIDNNPESNRIYVQARDTFGDIVAVNSIGLQDDDSSSEFVGLSAGDDNSCALFGDGGVTCWGRIYNNTTNSPVPVLVHNLTNAISVSAASYHRCALLRDGRVNCWGNNTNGQLGNGTKNPSVTVPVETLGISTAIAISTGLHFSCALLRDGSVKCWGSNFVGELGNGTTLESSMPVDVLGISNAITISSGFRHSCVVLRDGGVKCWGNNFHGELGDGTTIDSVVPVDVQGINNATTISAGYAHSCALLRDGGVQCWGFNDQGQLGNNTTTSNYVPVDVFGITKATSITVGDKHSCALREDGLINCWGRGVDGQLGNGSAENRPTVSFVTEIDNATAISAGYDHSCALLDDGRIKCWGGNINGQLGNNSAPIRSLVPVLVGAPNVTAISAGGLHTCALSGDGHVECWGNGTSGQLGNGKLINSISAVDVSRITNVIIAVSVGSGHSCALRDDGRVECWGSHTHGELGRTYLDLGLGSESSVSAPVSNITTGIAVSAGAFHNCALLSDGSVKCWGKNAQGQLGNGYTFDSRQALLVSNITNATAIAAGTEHTCARLNDGTVKCWGKNSSGQLGIGTTSNSTIPVEVADITNATALSAGDFHSCALLSNGSVKCWGSNTYGQLGNGTTTNSTIPAEVAGITNAVAISARNIHSCALLSEGSVKCWGSNTYGQLGNGTTTKSTVPVEVVGITNATSISAGSANSCAVVRDEIAMCWGLNNFGQLGNASTMDSTVPVLVR